MTVVRRLEANTPKGKKTAKATTQVLLEANPERVEFGVCNESAKEVYLALGPTAVKEEGIWLKEKSGSYVNLNYTGAVSVITKEGEGNVTFWEV